jgi:hypothetical protein
MTNTYNPVLVEVQNVKVSRVVVFNRDAGMVANGDIVNRTVLVCQDVLQAKRFFPDIASVDVHIDLGSMMRLSNGSQPFFRLGDVSRFFNDLFVSLQVSEVVPTSAIAKWTEYADELLAPLNQLRRKAIESGMKRGLSTEEILQSYAVLQDANDFVPSNDFCTYLRWALKFVERALQMELSRNDIAPYCLTRQQI